MKPQLALVDLKTVVRLDPSNVLGKAQLDATQKMIKRMQFEAVRTIHGICYDISKIAT